MISIPESAPQAGLPGGTVGRMASGRGGTDLAGLIGKGPYLRLRRELEANPGAGP